MIGYSYVDINLGVEIKGTTSHIAVHYSGEHVGVLLMDENQDPVDYIRVVGYLSPPLRGRTYKFVCDKFSIAGGHRD